MLCFYYHLLISVFVAYCGSHTRSLAYSVAWDPLSSQTTHMYIQETTDSAVCRLDICWPATIFSNYVLAGFAKEFDIQ